MLIIVGLGNPTLAYRNTYHNSGFAALDKLAEEKGGKFNHRFCQAKVCELYIKGEKVVLAKPQTYMNLSGDSVRELVGRYQAKPQEVVIVYDDVDLELGALRMREKGSAGTHNGMRDVVAKVSDQVVRLRIGIGKPPQEVPLYNFVLSRPKGETLDRWQAGVDRAAKVLDTYIATRSVSKAIEENK